jgi:phosphatidate phosphatase LPIN
MFPPFGNEDEDQTFNDWNFWKAPLPVLDLPPHLINPVRSTSSPLLDSKSNADASPPKRKPIVPDMSSLPKESVIDTPPRQKSNILRRLTSRSSLRSTSSSPAIPSLSSASLLPPKIKHSSSSNLPISSSHSTPTFSLEKASPVKKLLFEQLDDDAFDATLDALEDEIDMDSIPFI